MDWLSNWLIAFVQRENNPAGLALLAASAAVEYVFPPFPGDTVTLFGAVLITAYAWSFAGVFGAVMVGSCVGAMLDYYLGRQLRLRRIARQVAERPGTVERLVETFRRRGAVYLVLNRFFPGIRALFFVAAGMAGMRPLPVLLYSAVSAALWNLGLIAIGATLGANFDTLLAWVRRYTVVAWIAVGLVVVFFVTRALLRRRSRRRDRGG